MKLKSAQAYVDSRLRDGKTRLARWLFDRAVQLDPGLKEPQEVDAPDEVSVLDEDPILDVLLRALGNRTGKLRVSDAFTICGMEAGRVTQDQIKRFGRAIRKLGWERRRRRYEGGRLEYAYVKGTEKEREVELVVEYDPHMHTVRVDALASH